MATAGMVAGEIRPALSAGKRGVGSLACAGPCWPMVSPRSRQGGKVGFGVGACWMSAWRHGTPDRVASSWDGCLVWMGPAQAGMPRLLWLPGTPDRVASSRDARLIRMGPAQAGMLSLLWRHRTPGMVASSWDGRLVRMGPAQAGMPTPLAFLPAFRLLGRSFAFRNS